MRWMLDARYSYVEVVMENKDVRQKPMIPCYKIRIGGQVLRGKS